MSNSYTVYAKGDALRIRGFVENSLGVKFYEPEGPSSDGVFHADWMEVLITFEVSHDMLNDMGIEFTEYPTSIDFSRTGFLDDGILRDELCRILALILGRRLHRELGVNTIVVKDSQQLLEDNR